MKKQWCMGCMRQFSQEERRCPVCGYWHGLGFVDDHLLRPGTILAGRFLTGKLIGFGDFGNTYVGYDLQQERKIAIKEYFPKDFVRRDNHSAVVWPVRFTDDDHCLSDEANVPLEAQRMEYLKELKDIPGVAGVKEIFFENHTVYSTMDFIEGENLMRGLMKIGTLQFWECMELLTPVIWALEQMHQKGIIHRDISPDNLMLDTEGNTYLMDLGAAMKLDAPPAEGTIASRSVVKHGFSPPEQCRMQGGMGSWTDVYAMCATIYYTVTAKRPPKSTDRIFLETLDLQPPLTREQFDVLSRGMALDPKERIQTMGELLSALEAVTPAADADPENEPPRMAMDAFTDPMRTQMMPGVYILHRAETPDELKAMGYSSPQAAPFWGQTQIPRSEVRHIIFHDTQDYAPRDAFRVSEEGNETVLAWMENGTLYVATQGMLAFPEDASYLFYGFSNLQSIHFGGCVDTAYVRNLSGMFLGCTHLDSLACNDPKILQEYNQRT